MKTTRIHPRLVARMKQAPPAASAVVLVCGCLVLAGWVLDVEILKSLLEGRVAMNPVTALGLMLGAAALWLLNDESAEGVRRRLGYLAAGGMTLLGLAVLAGYAFDWQNPIDRWLFRDMLGDNRLAPNTALNFLLLGLALLLIDVEVGRRRRRPGQGLALVAELVALLAVIGYAYSALSLAGLRSYIPMALNTALSFGVLGLGVLFARADRGLMAIVTSEGAGGSMARRLLPPAIFLPAILGWLRLAGQEAGAFDGVTGLSLFVVATIVVLSILIWWNAGSINRADRRAKEAADENERRVRMIVDTAHDAFVAIDETSTIIDWNRQAESTFGWTRAEALGKSLPDTIIPPEYRDAHRQGLSRFLETGEGPVLNRRIELTALHRDGHSFPVELTIAPIRVQDSYVFGAFLHDITARMRARRELEGAKEAAEAANRAKSEFLANMSHEIRTPMNGIIGMTELALDSDLTAEQREYLTMVKSSADYLLAVINDILDFSKIEAGKLDLERADFSLRDSLDDTVATLALRAHKKGLELACHVLPDVPDSLVGDPGRLRQVVVNLVGNAVKFTDKGEVVLRVRRLEQGEDEVGLHLAVSDTGIGIPADKQDLLFKAFSQVDGSTTRRYSGTGLGLAISSHLVKMMRGRIWMESQPGQGSTFHFTARFGLSKSQVPRRGPRPPARLRGLSVLVADDNETNRRILQEMLINWRLKPTAVASGAAALAALEEARRRGQPFDLVLLDSMMPEMDGFELAERIKEHPDLAGATLMMISSADRREDAQRCRELGVAAYLTKPVKQSELLNHIMNVFGAVEAAEDGAPVAGTTAGPAAKPLDLLLVEDNVVNQKLALKLLEKRGHRTFVASNGQQAIELLEKQQFDAVLMDVQMPVMDGLEATAAIRLREQASGGHVPIIAMTAHAMKGDRERCLEAGMDGYVSKPLEPEELFEIVERVAAEAALVRQAVAEPGMGRAAGIRSSAFDRAAALERMDGDEKLLEELAGVFLTECPAWLADIQRGIAEADARLVERASHSLKGAAGSFAASEVFEAAQRLETLARGGQLAEAAQALSALEQSLERLRPALASATRKAT